MTKMTTLPASRLYTAIFQVIISASLAGLCIGISLPLVSIGLSEQSFSTSYIGIVGAVPAFGFVLAALVSKPICRELGYKQTVVIGILVSAASTFGLYDLSNNYLLLGSRLLSGFGTGLIIVLSESWVNQLVTANVRGRIIGLYATAYTLAQVSGPSVLAVFGGDGQNTENLQAINTLWFAHMIALISLAFAATSYPNVSKIGNTEAKQDTLYAKQNVASIVSFIVKLRYIGMMLPIFIFAYFDAAVLTLFPLIAESTGFTSAIALFMVSIIFVGDSIFQIPIGFLSDRYGRMRMLNICAGLSIFSCLMVAISMSQKGWHVATDGNLIFDFIVWPTLIIMGATTGGLYTLSLTRIGDSFSDLELVSANAAAGIVWSLGALLGPIFAGLLVERYGDATLMLSLITLTFIWLVGNRFSHGVVD